MDIHETVELAGTAIEVAGVAAIIIGAIGATALFLYRTARQRSIAQNYRPYRQAVGRAILLGLELLVAGDIIRTVAVTPTFTSVGVLAGIVLIRTFLSFSLEVELENRWPWQARKTDPPRTRAQH